MKSGAIVIALFGLLVAAPAQAATSPNSCRYSYDGQYRDMPVALETTLTPAGEVLPGDTVQTAEGSASVELPAYLAPFGYAVGLLHEGRNDIPVRVWIAIRGTNTAQRVQVVGPIAVTASTTITVDPADDNRFTSATPWVYTTPVVPALTWTAVGGDVTIAQADAGTITTQLPIGNSGALRAVTGSVVIDAEFAGGASIYMDCRPGRTTGIVFDFAGPGYDPAPATPVTTLAGPKNLSCITPADTVAYQRALLSVTGAPAEYSGTYTLPGVSLSSDVAYSDATVTIAGANTSEGTQTVKPGQPTTWTPTGNGPLAFTLALPRAAAPYGSVQLTTAAGVLDCSPAAVSGRYTFTPNLDTPVFAGAVKHVDPVQPPPAATPVPTPAGPAPTATPTAKPPVGAIKSKKLVARAGAVKLQLSCPKGSGTCTGTIALKTRAKPVRSLAARARYSIAAGRTKTIRLKLSTAGRSAVKRQRAVKAQVTLTTSGGVTATRRLTLTR